MTKYGKSDDRRQPWMRMGLRDSILPYFLAIDDPFVEALARLTPGNKAAYDSAILLGRSVICVWETNDGDHVLVYPRGAFGEETDMLQKSVFWGLRGASDKLKTVYLDMETEPEKAAKVRSMAKELDAMIKELDKGGWSDD